ncbi:reticulon-4b isoform X2 [Denticeps clupeoides]|uniref:reticulon-4b isoform X2 n=1 Tax=Denticeps clupeoides TaxID=299321 RepID=UPI0010A3AFFE|nr:reticulon-3-like isoform X2 [Denticeps clupeoides]
MMEMDDAVSSTTPSHEEPQLHAESGPVNAQHAGSEAEPVELSGVKGAAQDAVEERQESLTHSEPEVSSTVPEHEPTPPPTPPEAPAPVTSSAEDQLTVEEAATPGAAAAAVVPVPEPVEATSAVQEKPPEHTVVDAKEEQQREEAAAVEGDAAPEPQQQAEQEVGRPAENRQVRATAEPVLVPQEPPRTAAPVHAVQASPAEAAAPLYEPAAAPAAPPQPLMQFSAVVELVYWRDVKKSGLVFGTSLLLLLSLTMCSIVSVCSYIALALLSITITFRIYKGILQAVQKSDEGHPFKLYLDQEVTLSEDLVHKYSDVFLGRLNAAVGNLRSLFLVEDLVDSLKFAVLMWILTYVGALFNGLTILILGLIGAFSCPVIYEKHQTQIDHYLTMVNSQIKDVVEKIQSKVRGQKKKIRSD